MKNNCVIGYTGFIGSHLAEKFQPQDKYNSKNINDIQGKSYDKIYFAGNSGFKWIVNKNPKQDWENIIFLIGCLKNINAERFILISTIDIYEKPIDVNEDYFDNTGKQRSYGLHRYKFECFVRDHFKKHKDCVLIFIRDTNLKSVSETLKSYKTKKYYKNGQDKLIRNYGIGAQIIKTLNIKKMILVTRSKKKVVGLEGYGIKITRQEII